MTTVDQAVRHGRIPFSGEMVRAILEGRKTQTRRVVKPQFEEPDPEWHSGPWNYSDPGLRDIWTTEPRMDAAARFYVEGDSESRWRRCPYGQPGDRLRVLETWAVGKCADGLKPRELDPVTWLGNNGGLWYAADNAVPRHPISERGKWRPGRFMPGRWTDRISLEITNVRVERIRDISPADCQAEGAPGGDTTSDLGWRYSFGALWNSINEKRGYGWGANPWVWVIEFRRVTS